MHIKDPVTGQTLIRLRDPKLAIKGFSDRGAKCINLHKFMRETNVTPDFGFDATETAIFSEYREPWEYMCKVMAPKYRQKALWHTINKMNALKRQYNRMLTIKFKTLPKVLKKMSLARCRDLFNDFKAQVDLNEYDERIDSDDSCERRSRTPPHVEVKSNAHEDTSRQRAESNLNSS